jgi:hypothetical protein
MRQLWVGIIVVIVALALGVGGAYGASLLVRNRLATLPATITRLNNNAPSGGQPGNNSRRFNNPQMNPGGQPGSGQNGFRNWGGRGRMMGPGMGGRFFNCPVPNQGQNPGGGQGQNPGQLQNNCPSFNQPGVPGAPDNGAGNGPF